MNQAETYTWKDYSDDHVLLMRRFNPGLQMGVAADYPIFEVISVRPAVLADTLKVRHEMIFLKDYMTCQGINTLNKILTHFSFDDPNAHNCLETFTGEYGDDPATLATFIADDRFGTDEDTAAMDMDATEAAEFIFDLTGIEYCHICGELVTPNLEGLETLVVDVARCRDCCNFTADEDDDDTYMCMAKDYMGCEPEFCAFNCNCGRFRFSKDNCLSPAGICLQAEDDTHVVGYFVLENVKKYPALGYESAILSAIYEKYGIKAVKLNRI